MTPVAVLSTTPGQAELAAFRASLQASNPFLDNRINGPALDDPDVPQIHQPAFARLTGLAEEALRARRGLGVMLWGEAGIGKSHVLSRLARWAGERACLVYLHNLQAAPAQLPRSLLRSVISQLTLGQRRRFYGTQLFSLVYGAVLASLSPGVRELPWTTIERAFSDWVGRLTVADVPGAAPPDRTVYEVLFRFFRSVCEQRVGKGDGRASELAVRWLAGEGLDPEDAGLLGLSPPPGPDQPVALFDAQQIKQVLVALMHLAVCQRRPFLLAFDQVDNLDGEQFAALARFLEALIDSAPNLLVVMAGIQDSVIRWHEQHVVQDSAWDRLAQFKLPLHRISGDEAAQIVRARLRTFLQPFAALEPVAQRIQADPLFPLGEPWRRQFLHERVDLRPRDVINWAGEGWRQLQDRLRRETANWLLGSDGAALAPHACVPSGQGPPRTPTEFEVQERIDQQLREAFAERCQASQAAPQNLPPDEDRLLRLLHDLLETLREQVPSIGLSSVEMLEGRGASPPPHQLVVIREMAGGGRLRTGVLILATDNKLTVTNSLKRLLAGVSQVDRQLLIWDARIGLPLSEKGRELLEALESEMSGQFLSLEIGLNEYAELDALHGVLGQVRSEELTVEASGRPRPITADEAVESLYRQGRFQASRVLRELT